MPDGRVQRIDPAARRVYIVRRGREYVADLDDVERHAQVPGARVHFDLTRFDGVEGAAGVHLREGTRTNRRQRRFGDLTGARQPGAKVKSTANLLGVDVTTQPYRVVQTWVDALADNDIDGVVSLYGADAVVHAPAGELQGRSRVRSFVADEKPAGFDRHAVALHGHDEVIDVVWPPGTVFGAGGPRQKESISRLRVDHGRIVEQWDHVADDADDADASQNPILVIDERVGQVERNYLEKQLEAFQKRLDKPLLFSRVKVDVFDNASRDHRVNASATYDVGRQLLRAHVGAPTVTEAIDLLIGRLGTQIERVRDENRSPVGQPPKPGTWRRGNQPTIRPGYYDRPLDERELVRHKTYAADELTIEEALWDMAVLDYDFFLFAELESGKDCMLDHTSADQTDTDVVLHCIDKAERDQSLPPGVDVDPGEAPLLSVRAAIERLDTGVEPHVFFRNASTDRGNVVYRRFDGHYGLITPAHPAL